MYQATNNRVMSIAMVTVTPGKPAVTFSKPRLMVSRADVSNQRPVKKYRAQKLTTIHRFTAHEDNKPLRQWSLTTVGISDTNRPDHNGIRWSDWEKWDEFSKFQMQEINIMQQRICEMTKKTFHHQEICVITGFISVA